VALDPDRPRRGKFNSRWRVIVNVTLEELFAWEF